MAAEHIAWLNGSLVPLSQASLSIFDAGVLSGAIVSERLRTFRHEPFLLDDHIARLAASAEAAFVPLSLSAARIADLIREIVQRNAELVPPEYDLSVSVFATPGVDRAGTLCVYATAIPAHQYVASYEGGISLAIPATHAMPAGTLSPQIKTRSRLHWHIADAQAERLEGTALLLHTDGTAAETATGNLFVYRNEELLTPKRAGTLHGISQSYVMRLAGWLGLTCREAELLPDDVIAAREAFVTSSVYCMLPVVRLNRSQIGDGRPGPVYGSLLRVWSEAVEVDIAGQMSLMAGGKRAK
jgi:branched-subunit amino acid aminotransferase/4-amino-4-deoxychorismate lyase